MRMLKKTNHIFIYINRSYLITSAWNVLVNRLIFKYDASHDISIYIGLLIIQYFWRTPDWGCICSLWKCYITMNSSLLFACIHNFQIRQKWTLLKLPICLRLWKIFKSVCSLEAVLYYLNCEFQSLLEPNQISRSSLASWWSSQFFKHLVLTTGKWENILGITLKGTWKVVQMPKMGLIGIIEGSWAQLGKCQCKENPHQVKLFEQLAIWTLTLPE